MLVNKTHPHIFYFVVFFILLYYYYSRVDHNWQKVVVVPVIYIIYLLSIYYIILYVVVVKVFKYTWLVSYGVGNIIVYITYNEISTPCSFTSPRFSSGVEHLTVVVVVVVVGNSSSTCSYRNVTGSNPVTERSINNIIYINYII